jgi:hypothetical protein
MFRALSDPAPTITPPAPKRPRICRTHCMTSQGEEANKREPASASRLHCRAITFHPSLACIGRPHGRVHRARPCSFGSCSLQIFEETLATVSALGLPIDGVQSSQADPKIHHFRDHVLRLPVSDPTSHDKSLHRVRDRNIAFAL